MIGQGVQFERVRRITGYLTGDTNGWNEAKKAELKDRTVNTVQKFKCIKGMSHPNLGVMFKKGKVYELSEDRGDEITLGGWNIYKHFLETNFEEVK